MLLGFDVGTIPTKSDINKQMYNFGSLLVLLDSVMSLLATKRGCVTQDIIDSCRKSLSALKLSWYHCGLSFTPKFHVLLEHAVPFLEQTGGFADMGEDQIERGHQDRAHNLARLICLKNKDKFMASQAKFQGLKHVAGLQSHQESVAKGRKRKLKEGRTESLAAERSNNKHLKRVEERSKTLLEHSEKVEAGEFTVPLPKPRSTIKASVLRQSIT